MRHLAALVIACTSAIAAEPDRAAPLELAKHSIRILRDACESARIRNRTGYQITRDRLSVTFDSLADKDAALSRLAIMIEAIPGKEASHASQDLLLYRLSRESIGKLDGPMKVIQVVDSSNSIVSFRGQSCWLSKVNTKGMVDGEHVTLDAPIKVIGTKGYATVTGSTNTIWLLEPTDLTATIALRAEEYRLRSVRGWTVDAADLPRDGVLREVRYGTAMIEFEDGEDLKVPLGRLSGPDREYIADWKADHDELHRQSIELFRKYKGNLGKVLDQLELRLQRIREI